MELLRNKQISAMLNFIYIFMYFLSSSKGQLWSTYYFPTWFRGLNDDVQCPQPTGQFSHPKYCDLWLNCWKGRAVVGRCQQGLVFNEKIHSCDYKHNVDCSGKANSQGPPPLDPRCPQHSGIFVNPADCSEYFVCQSGIVSVYKCPNGSYYNTALGVCDYQPEEGCVIEGEETSNTKPPISNQKPQRPTITQKPDDLEEKPQPQPIVEHPGPSTQNPQPVSPINEKPPSPVEKPQPPSTTDEPPTPASIAQNPDEENFSPARPVEAAGTPTLPSTTYPQTQFTPKPQIPVTSPPPVETTTPESSTPESESTSSTMPTVVNLKPKPPFKPESEEEAERPPPVDLSNIKPKPPFQPPSSKPNPEDRPTQIPPTLNPGILKPQRPPGSSSGSSTPTPVDGEDDPNILFPFLPNFPDLFRCPLATGIFPIIGDCTSVIACLGGSAHQLRCPKGETYDMLRGRCGPEKNLICSKASNNLITSGTGGGDGIDVVLMSPKDVVYAYLPVAMFNKLLKVEMIRVRSQETAWWQR